MPALASHDGVRVPMLEGGVRRLTCLGTGWGEGVVFVTGVKRIFLQLEGVR